MSTLPADVEERVNEYLKSGWYTSQGEVLHAAMDALEDRLKLAEFRRKNEIAEEQSRNGELIELDEEDLYRRLQERFKARHQTRTV